MIIVMLAFMLVEGGQREVEVLGVDQCGVQAREQGVSTTFISLSLFNIQQN